jgi:soluble lytic murein transglycosylase-like protein
MQQPIKQMLTASAVMCVIFATAFSLVDAGTAKEQAERTAVAVATITTTTTTAATTTTTATTTKPTRRYFDVPLAHPVQEHIFAECEQYNIQPAIIVAMIHKESNYKPNNMGDNGNSFGLMQIQPRWHSKRMEKLNCTDLLDPYQNITVGVDYLAELLNRYDGDIAKALVAYNQGSYKGTVTQYASAVLAEAERIGKDDGE